MRPEVSFIFGGISTGYDSSVSSLLNVISVYLSLSKAERPFTVKNIHHVSQKDGNVTTLPFDEPFVIDDLNAIISSEVIRPRRTLVNAFEAMASCKEYVVNLLHGQFGEDGGAQTLAAVLGLKGTFGDPEVASLTMNKYAMSSFVSSLIPNDIVRIPKTILIKAKDKLDMVQFVNSFQGAIVVKPNSLGSSLLTERFDEPEAHREEVIALINAILEQDGAALLQEFVHGKEYSCGCIANSSDIVTLPVVEIKTNRGLFGRKEKSIEGMSDLSVVDDRNSNSIANRIKSVTRIIASTVDIYNAARFDFLVSSRSEIVFLECNYIPGMGKNSIFPKMLENHGMTVIDMIHWVHSNSKPFTRKRCLVRDKAA
ncbi:D-alanine--D-alanine ligase [Mesorhizobium sp. M0074]|uniref:D-alanine--D-alanine ligase n=1 Tax=Mesorhizobium sp. M0074 TaxID=2956869 RepID=UPI0033350570